MATRSPAAAPTRVQLSPHFKLAELTVTQQPFANVPGPAEIAALTALCVHVLEPVRKHFGKPVRVNSGYRSDRVNRAVGSSRTSQHRRGEAGDIEIDGVPNAELACWIRDNLAFDQVILEAYHPGQPNSGWVHVSYSGRSKRGGSKGINSVLTMTLGSHGAVYSVGIHQ